MASVSRIFPTVQTDIVLRNSDGTALSSDQALPTSLILSDFQGPDGLAQISIGGETSLGTIRADITSLSITPVAAVPLPATMPMMLLGLGLVGVFLRAGKSDPCRARLAARSDQARYSTSIFLGNADPLVSFWTK